MKRVVLPLIGAFGVFLVALAAVFGMDYRLRLSDGDIRTGGLAVELSVVVVVLVGCGCLAYLYRTLSGRLTTWTRLAIVAVCAVAGFFVYAAGGLLYMTEAGLPL